MQQILSIVIKASQDFIRHSEEDLKENFGKGLPYVIERFDKLCEVYKDK